MTDFFQYLVYTDVLVVFRHDLGHLTTAVVKQQKVLENIEQARFIAGSANHGIEAHDTGLIFFNTLPVQKEFVRTCNGTDPGIGAIAQDDECIAMEYMRNGVFVVRDIVCVGIAEISMMRF